MDDKILTPHEALIQQQKSLEEGLPEQSEVEYLAEQNIALAESLLHTVERCEDARQFGAVIRLALNSGQVDFAKALIDIMISRIDTVLGGYYDDIEDKDLVDMVEEKMKNPSI